MTHVLHLEQVPHSLIEKLCTDCVDESDRTQRVVDKIVENARAQGIQPGTPAGEQIKDTLLAALPPEMGYLNGELRESSEVFREFLHHGAHDMLDELVKSNKPCRTAVGVFSQLIMFGWRLAVRELARLDASETAAAATTTSRALLTN
jgi:hypothetical protein